MSTCTCGHEFLCHAAMSPDGGVRCLVDDCNCREYRDSEGGLALIVAERRRQREMWGDAHDDRHDGEQLAQAAICYAKSAVGAYVRNPSAAYREWPWDEYHWRPKTDQSMGRDDRVRDLVKAGALIVSEIDRLHRQATAEVIASMEHNRQRQAADILRLQSEATIKTSVRRCARCGMDHPGLEFSRLSRSDDGRLHSHWARCPTNGEPIMMRIESE